LLAVIDEKGLTLTKQRLHSAMINSDVISNPEALIDFDFFNDFSDTRNYLKTVKRQGINIAVIDKRLGQLEMLNDRYKKARAYDFQKAVQDKKDAREYQAKLDKEKTERG